MRKYSANRSFNPGNLAIDFPVTISPTIDETLSLLPGSFLFSKNQPGFDGHYGTGAKFGGHRTTSRSGPYNHRA